MNKTKAVRDHLLNGKTITQTEAFQLYGTTRLSAIIFNLRREGLNIITEKVQVRDRFGNTCYPGRYYIPSDTKGER